MMKWIALALALLTSTAQAQQAVHQSGVVTPGHLPSWVTNGIIKDAGTAANGALTSLGVTASGPAICQNSGPVSGPYSQICLGANTNSSNVLSSIQYGGATAYPLNFNSPAGVNFSSPIYFNSALPSGSSAQVLCENNAGVLSFNCASGGGGGGSPGGNSGSVQINSSGNFAGVGPTNNALFYSTGTGTASWGTQGNLTTASSLSSATVPVFISTGAVQQATVNTLAGSSPIGISAAGGTVTVACSTCVTPTNLSASIDSAFGSTQGSILYRNSTVWTVLTPGTSGFFLETQGSSANPTWAAASGGSGCSTGGSAHNLLTADGAGGCTTVTVSSLTNGALSLGSSGTAGSVAMGNATSGTVTLEPVTGALGSKTASLPANTGTIAETNLAQTYSAAQSIANATNVIFQNASNSSDAYLDENSSNVLEIHIGTSGFEMFSQTPSGLFDYNITSPNIFAFNVGVLFPNNDLKLKGTGTGVTSVVSANTTSTNYSVTFPAATDTVTENTQAQTLTNKTLTSSTNVLGGVTMTLGSDATGDVYYRNSSGDLTRLGIGSAGQVLTVSSGVPVWATGGGGGGGQWITNGNYIYNSNTGSVAVGGSQWASASPTAALEVGGFIRSINNSFVPSSGVGLEVVYTGSSGVIQAYNRTSALFQPMLIQGSSIELAQGNVITTNSVYMGGPGPWIDVKSGANGCAAATGNGSTNDQAAIQCQVTYANGAGGLATLYFPCGTYLVNGGGVATASGKYMHLKGENVDCTFIEVTDDETAVNWANGSFGGFINDIYVNCTASSPTTNCVHVGNNAPVAMYRTWIIGGNWALNDCGNDQVIMNTVFQGAVSGDVLSCGANWYFHASIDNPNAVGVGFEQTTSYAGEGATENHLTLCDFSGNWQTAAVVINDGGAQTAITEIHGSVFGPVSGSVNGLLVSNAKTGWTSLVGDELSGLFAVNNATVFVGNMGGGQTLSGSGAASSVCAGNYDFTC